MVNKSEKAELQIVEAARVEFMEKGFSGARMQAIANKAGINKAMLHYYFRSKELLFERIFEEAFRSFIEVMVPKVMQDLKMEVFLKYFVDSYIDLIIANPFLPGFILQELSQNPERFQKLMLKAGARPDLISHMIEREIAAGNIHPISAGEFMINAWSMCLFPFISRSLFQGFFWNGNEEAYDEFLKERKKTAFEFLCRALFVNPSKIVNQ